MGALPVPEFLKDRFQPPPRQYANPVMQQRESIIKPRNREREKYESTEGGNTKRPVKAKNEYDSEEEKIMNIIGNDE